ncbi:MAG: hypothetical protein C4337_06465, partial [Armatimonadota bacterium]
MQEQNHQTIEEPAEKDGTSSFVDHPCTAARRPRPLGLGRSTALTPLVWYHLLRTLTSKSSGGSASESPG